MKQLSQIFSFTHFTGAHITWNDILVFVGIGTVVYLCVLLAGGAPLIVRGPRISLSPKMLPWYALLSIKRMTFAYLLALFFTLIYGYISANSHRFERILMPLLDVLQSVPILSFLPVALLSLSAIMPQKLAAELASIVLIFTSQVWHLTFAWYQSLTTIPKELQEASTIFRLNSWLRFKTLEFPFGAISLIWNSMMSWAGGWFFLMAAEIFTVGERDFRLPGLGAYLHEAANHGNFKAILWGIGTLILIIVALDQLIWRPLLAWSDNFKLEMLKEGKSSTSWCYDALRNSVITEWIDRVLIHPIIDHLDWWILDHFPMKYKLSSPSPKKSWKFIALSVLFATGLLLSSYHIGKMLFTVPLGQWGEIGVGLGATMARVIVSLGIALLWTIPVGVAIGTNPRLAAWLQPVIQITASVPATALFPVILLLVLNLPGGINLAAVILMLMGMQWYLLFNVIAGAMLIPRDLQYTSSLLQLGWKDRWCILILPALFPYIITGAITASGGAWNACIVAEYVQFGGKTLFTKGIGTIIVQSTARGNYALLMAATLSMIITVAFINMLVWQRLYRLAEEQFRME